MKSTSLSTKFITALLLLAVIAYFGVQGYRYVTDPETTAIVYRYRSEQAIAVRGYVVREEQVVDCAETLLELTHAEGEHIGAGDTIATVYRSAEALRATQELEALRAQKEQLEYARSAANDTETALKLDSEIRDQILSVRAAYEAGSFSALDALSDRLKTTVLKREYAYNGSEELGTRLEELDAQIREASAASGGTTRVTASVSGTYSAVADGYEGVLTPESLADMTPSGLAAVSPQSVSSTVGKIVSGSKWYFAASVSEADAAKLRTGQRLTLRMASGVDFDLPVTLTRVSEAENGNCLVVTESDKYLAYVTLLREQNAEIVIDEYEGLRIPKNALRVNGDGVSGVYCLIGRTAYFKPVNIIYQGGEYCLVEPGSIEAATESQKSLLTLRTNDEVIISAGELYNGKVVD